MNLKVGFERQEKNLIFFIKNNRTKFILDFFRKNSAAIVMIIITMLVAAGNVNTEKDEGGFLFSYFQKTASNEEKIEQRVKSHSFSNNLTTVPLAIASVPVAGETDTQAMAMSDEDMSRNQMQFQVLTATTAPDAKELLDEGADVAVYEVKEGDTVSTIAQSFNITVNTILWANDIDNVDKIMPGDKIFILPVTGLEHVVKNGDTIDSIAKKYSADKEKIIAFNELNADGKLQEGIKLVIPDGKIAQSSQTASTPDNLLQKRNYYSSSAGTDTSRTPSLIDQNPKGGHKFPYGYCTWYVATRKYVPWGGNAGTWLYHAKAYGASTGKSPKVGAIVVTNESWYGHVGVVEKVSGGSITISEMNYVGFAKKSTRTISSSSRTIKGYIY